LTTSTNNGKSDSKDESKHESESESESESKIELGSGMNSVALANSMVASGELIEGSGSDEQSAVLASPLASPLSASGEFEVNTSSKHKVAFRRTCCDLLS
jgi:hypothetical protein